MCPHCALIAEYKIIFVTNYLFQTNPSHTSTFLELFKFVILKKNDRHILCNHPTFVVHASRQWFTALLTCPWQFLRISFTSSTESCSDMPYELLSKSVIYFTGSLWLSVGDTRLGEVVPTCNITRLIDLFNIKMYPCI